MSSLSTLRVDPLALRSSGVVDGTCGREALTKREKGAVVMDLNLVVLCGRLASPGELREFESGTRLLRLLISLRTEEPTRRVDVVPVTLWDPEEDLVEAVRERGIRIWAVGAVQRRFWEGSDGRSSRIEIVALQVTVHEPETEEVEA